MASMRRLVLLAATVRATSAALALPSVLTTRGHNATAYGAQHRQTLISANNYAMTLLDLRRFAEAKKLLRKVAPVARRALGAEHALTLSLREDLSRATLDGKSSADEKREALQMLEDVAAVMRRVLGPAHPDTLHAQNNLEGYRQHTE